MISIFFVFSLLSSGIALALARLDVLCAFFRLPFRKDIFSGYVLGDIAFVESVRGCIGNIDARQPVPARLFSVPFWYVCLFAQGAAYLGGVCLGLFFSGLFVGLDLASWFSAALSFFLVGGFTFLSGVFMQRFMSALLAQLRKDAALFLRNLVVSKSNLAECRFARAVPVGCVELAYVTVGAMSLYVPIQNKGVSELPACASISAWEKSPHFYLSVTLSDC